ncbi:MAG TPA: site-specific integrase [Xanthobacteraceae bacterium]|nr:site-specific integrase [Xanthobacteraceae bacterium]
MGVVKNEYGVFQARVRVPERLQEAVAQVQGSPKPRVSWLKRSLHTKDLRDANIKAKPILIEFDRVLAKAEALAAERPLVTDLDEKRMQQIAAYHYACILEEDDEVRLDGYELDVVRNFPGMSSREMRKTVEGVDIALAGSQTALAKGDTSGVEFEVDDLLDIFRINLDKKSASYRKLAMAVLRERVRAFQALERRNNGEPVDTPVVPEPDTEAAPTGGGLRDAFAGWKKERKRPPNTVSEFENGIRRFIELHGDIPIVAIKRSHARAFREALQDMPRSRTGVLRGAALTALAKWGKEHPDAPKIASGTVNKLLGACQTVALWARDNGVIPEDMLWSDPFANMRLEVAEPEREPWSQKDLRTLFASPVYALSKRPEGGRGEAAYWLPLLALYSGARLNELAPLIASDVTPDEETGVVSIDIAADEERGKRIKTASSRRVVPIHPELKRLGFLELVEERRKADGELAPLFPLLTAGPRGGHGEAWSKWFGRYIRSIGVQNSALVFHSFRHNFKDALRNAGVSEDINDALTGHSGGGVGRRYGAKDMARRFGLTALAKAVAKVEYAGLDLSPLYLDSIDTKEGA